MVELLSRRTKMRVVEAADGGKLTPNVIHLLPPKRTVQVVDGALSLADKPQGALSLPVDILLRSMAATLGGRAIAIVLWGTGSDGTRGVRAIKEAGGLVVIQDPQSAKFDGMPREAIATGTADFVLAPAKIPDQLVSYAAHAAGLVVAPTEPSASRSTAFARLLGILSRQTGVDFAQYKPATVERRVHRQWPFARRPASTTTRRC